LSNLTTDANYIYLTDMLMAHVLDSLWFKVVVHLVFDNIVILVNFASGLTIDMSWLAGV